MELIEFAKKQEVAVNDMAKKARTFLILKPTFDLEDWFNKQRKVNPFLKGVSIKEFGSAVLEIKPFKSLG